MLKRQQSGSTRPYSRIWPAFSPPRSRTRDSAPATGTGGRSVPVTWNCAPGGRLAGVRVDPRHAVGFGDSLNDMPMIGVVGRFVAMANSHPTVLAAAAEITQSVADDGVAAWLARAGVSA